MLPLADFMSAVAFARDGSLLPHSQLHGEPHWRAVAAQGLFIAKRANLGRNGRAVAALFGLFHDCRRENDGHDPEHGLRGSEAFGEAPGLAAFRKHYLSHLGEVIRLSCVHHDQGGTSDEPLVGLGWDADRSVLGRCGITPTFGFFSVIDGDDFPDLIEAGWSATANPPSWEQIWEQAFARG